MPPKPQSAAPATGTARPNPQVQPRGQPDPLGDNASIRLAATRESGGDAQGASALNTSSSVLMPNGSVYDPITLTILINLEHPLVVAALGDGRVEDTTFRRLSYEMRSASTRWALATSFQTRPNMPPDDLLYEVPSTLNRISTAAVALLPVARLNQRCQLPQRE